jgi:hypothetical protein
LSTDRDELSNLHRGHSIDASYQVSVYYTLHVGIHILIFFLAHRAKGNVGFWHLSFVVYWLGSFKGEDFLYIDQSETRIVCGGHVC